MEKVEAAPEIDHEAALARRLAFRAGVAAGWRRSTRRHAHQSRSSSCIARSRPRRDRPVLMAVASKGSGVINEHFGHAKEFLIYEASHTGARLIGHPKD